jgi:hypothetical protein
MTSTEKLLGVLDGLMGLEDEQLSEIVPMFTPFRTRLGLAAAARYVPTDPEQLDLWTTMAGRIALSIRSDDAPALEAKELMEPLDIPALLGQVFGG